MKYILNTLEEIQDSRQLYQSREVMRRCEEGFFVLSKSREGGVVAVYAD